MPPAAPAAAFTAAATSADIYGDGKSDDKSVCGVLTAEPLVASASSVSAAGPLSPQRGGWESLIGQNTATGRVKLRWAAGILSVDSVAAEPCAAASSSSSASVADPLNPPDCIPDVFKVDTNRNKSIVTNLGEMLKFHRDSYACMSDWEVHRIADAMQQDSLSFAFSGIDAAGAAANANHHFLEERRL